MKKAGLFLGMMKSMGIILLIELVIISVIMMIGWWAGWQTETEFKKAILVAGILVIGIGFLGIKRNQDSSDSVETESSKSATSKSRWERTKQTLLGLAGKNKFMLLMFVAGGICLTIGLLM